MVDSYKSLNTFNKIINMLQISRQHQDRLYDELPIILAILDSDLRIVKTNSPACEYFGRSMEAVLGKEIFEFFASDSVKHLEQKILELQNQPHQEVWLETEEKMGEKKNFIHWELSFLESENLNSKLLILIGRDVTALRNAHDKIFELQKNIELSRIVQSLLLPKSKQYNDKVIEIDSFYKPTSAIGGDWWWQKKLPDDSILVLLGDVTGHGLGPAMVTAVIAGINETLYQTHIKKNQPIEDMLSTLDYTMSHLCNHLYLMTLVTILISADGSQATIWNNGAPHPLICKADGSFQSLRSAGTIIGNNKATFIKEEITLESKDMIFIYTDGIFSVNFHGRALTKKKIAQIISMSIGENARETVQNFSKIALSEAGDRAVYTDDITLIGIRKI